MHNLPFSEQQIMALEALQLFAPLGHALGLGTVSAKIEDICFKVSPGDPEADALNHAYWDSLPGPLPRVLYPYINLVAGRLGYC